MGKKNEAWARQPLSGNKLQECFPQTVQKVSEVGKPPPEGGQDQTMTCIARIRAAVQYPVLQLQMKAKRLVHQCAIKVFNPCLRSSPGVPQTPPWTQQSLPQDNRQCLSGLGSDGSCIQRPGRDGLASFRASLCRPKLGVAGLRLDSSSPAVPPAPLVPAGRRNSRESSGRRNSWNL